MKHPLDIDRQVASMCQPVGSSAGRRLAVERFSCDGTRRGIDEHLARPLERDRYSSRAHAPSQALSVQQHHSSFQNASYFLLLSLKSTPSLPLASHDGQESSSQSCLSREHSCLHERQRHPTKHTIKGKHQDTKRKEQSPPSRSPTFRERTIHYVVADRDLPLDTYRHRSGVETPSEVTEDDKEEDREDTSCSYR